MLITLALVLVTSCGHPWTPVQFSLKGPEPPRSAARARVVAASPQPWPGEGATVYLAASVKTATHLPPASPADYAVVAPCHPFVLLKADPEPSRWIAQGTPPLEWRVQLEGPWLARMHKTEAECDAQFTAEGEPEANRSDDPGAASALTYWVWGFKEYFGPARQVKTGMTYDQTRAIMGPPIRTVSFLGVEEWAYCAERGSGRLLAFYFEDGRVIAKNDSTLHDWWSGGCFSIVRSLSLPYGIDSDSKPPQKVRDLWVARAPRVILVSGTALDRPVLLSDWNDNGTLMRALTAPVRPAPGTLENRLSYDLAFFWGERWVSSLDWSMREWLRPEQASQHGRFYPAIASAPALFVFDDERGPKGEAARAAGRFRSIGEGGLDVLAGAGLKVSVQ